MGSSAERYGDRTPVTWIWRARASRYNTYDRPVTLERGLGLHYAHTYAHIIPTYSRTTTWIETGPNGGVIALTNIFITRLLFCPLTHRPGLEDVRCASSARTVNKGRNCGGNYRSLTKVGPYNDRYNKKNTFIDHTVSNGYESHEKRF